MMSHHKMLNFPTFLSKAGQYLHIFSLLLTMSVIQTKGICQLSSILYLRQMNDIQWPLEADALGS